MLGTVVFSVFWIGTMKSDQQKLQRNISDTTNKKANKRNASTHEVVDTGFEADYCHSGTRCADARDGSLKATAQQ